MAQGLFLRFAFIFNFLKINYFSFLDMLGLVIHHFWWKECFSRTPGSYRYTNSIELVPRFGLWPSPPARLELTKVLHAERNWKWFQFGLEGNMRIDLWSQAGCDWWVGLVLVNLNPINDTYMSISQLAWFTLKSVQGEETPKSLRNPSRAWIESI